MSLEEQEPSETSEYWDAGVTPARFKIRSACFSNIQALGEMAEGEFVPDLVAALASLDTIMGEVDR